MDQGCDLVRPKAKLAHGRQEVPDLGAGQVLPQLADDGLVLGDEASGGALAVDQTLAFHLGHGPLHGVGVDPCLGGPIPDGGEAVTRLQLAGDDPLLDLGDELGVNGQVAAEFPWTRN